MNNVVATTSYPGAATDLFPEQNLTTTWLYPDYGWTACDTCNMIPTPQTSQGYSACNTCTAITQPRHYYRGNDVGPPRQTGTQGYLVTNPKSYYPDSYLRAVANCDLTLLPIERGVNWQSYNVESQCKQFQY